ncbi:MAG: DUF5335 domain-containing protein [Gammaproteobacteria bacterium]|nr:DUF5335 domain-containing protein [Gammaproteobacteria bacterium]
MATRQLSRTEWQSYFDGVARAQQGKQVEIEVAGLSVGHQIEAEWLPLNGLTYEPKEDMLEVSTESIDHLIHHPKQISVEEDIEGLRSVEIIDQDDNHQIIKLRAPLALPKL